MITQLQSKGAITLKRDCEVIQIPDGTPMKLEAGAQVFLAQQLGDTFTIRLPIGLLARVDGMDADALGHEVPEAAQLASSIDPDGPLTEPMVRDQLRSVFDPEIPVNIVDLGLIYGCKVKEAEGGYDVEIEMTLTAPGCGMGQVLRDDVERRVRAIPQVKNAEIELIFYPPWDRSMMTEAARLQLGLM